VSTAIAQLSDSQLAALTAAVVDSVKMQLVAPQMLDQCEAHRYCGLSRSTWFKLRSADRLPQPVHVEGSGLRWRKSDLDRWMGTLKPRRK